MTFTACWRILLEGCDTLAVEGIGVCTQSQNSFKRSNRGSRIVHQEADKEVEKRSTDDPALDGFLGTL